MKILFSALALWLGAQPVLALAQGAGAAVTPGMTFTQSLAPAPAAESVPGVPMSAASAPVTGRAVPLGTLATLGADYRIGPNDLLDVEVFGVPDLKRSVRVNSSGQISLALVGNVLVAGLSAQQAEELIAAKYAKNYLQDPQVSVFIKEFTTQRITVEGAVVKPGIYPVTGQVTLLRALALAGGGAAYAELEEIMVFRIAQDGTKLTQIYDLEKIRAGEFPDPVVLADDVIVVKRNRARTVLRDSLFRDLVDSINPFSVFTPR